MTEKLYYQDPFLKNFTADIISFQEGEGGYHLQLDRTAFYPEGGGQPADLGLIGSSRVKHVYEKRGEVFHVVEELPNEKKKVECQLDWERRFDFMQQHTGQHLLSAAALKLYDARTVGFHLGETHITIDTDIPLSADSVDRLEEEVNQLIYQNRQIRVKRPSPAELERLDLRKDPEVSDNIRVIKIEGIDLTPCGGTHLQETGQLGLISIIKFENYKEGTRLTFLCGKRARQDYSRKNKITAELRDILSVSNRKLVSEATRLQQELSERDSRISELQDELLDYQAEKLLERAEKLEGYNIICQLFPTELSRAAETKSNSVVEIAPGDISGDISPDITQLKQLAEKLIENDSTIVIFGQQEAGKARLILARSENIPRPDMNELIKEVMPLLKGGGGGQEHFAQGGGSKVEELPAALEEAYQRIVRGL